MLEWVISSSVLILLVLIVRALGKGRLSCRVRYALWLLILVRLLVPVQLIETGWGVTAPLPERLTEPSIYVLPVSREEGIPVEHSGEVRDPFAADSFGYSRQSGTAFIKYADKWSVADILHMIWFAGAGLLAAVLLLSNLRFARRLERRRVPYDALCGGMRVYVAEGLASPCLVGVFRPSVYLTPESTRNEQTLRHVLAHETTHRLHGDCVWSALRLIALCLHWYNPLVWYAVIVSKRDGELACDEATLARLGEEERIPYGETLLSMVIAKPGGRDLLSVSTAMTAEKKTLRERIETIAKHPRTRGAALLLTCAVLLSATVFAFSKSAVKNPAVREYAPDDGAAALSPDATKAPFDAEQAMQNLVDSVQWFEGDGGVRYVSFRLPGAYDPEPKWNLHISGRSVAEDGMSMSRHYFEGESWRAGKSYSIELTDLTELTLYAWLDDADSGRVVDLLTGETHAMESAINTGSRWDVDLDGDGAWDHIYLDALKLAKREEARFWIETADGTQIDVGTAGTAHVGWNTAALVDLDSGTYLMLYHPTMFQGEARYAYQLFWLENGDMKGSDEMAVEFSVNPGEAENNNMEAMRIFQEQANGIWSRSRLLFTTDQEVLEHLYYAETGESVLTNGSFYIGDLSEAVRYEETMCGLLDAAEPMDIPAGLPSEP